MKHDGKAVPAGYIVPDRDYIPERSYRRPGSDHSHIRSMYTVSNFEKLIPERRRELVLEQLRENGPMRRQELSEKFGVSGALGHALDYLRRSQKKIDMDGEGRYYLLEESVQKDSRKDAEKAQEAPAKPVSAAQKWEDEADDYLVTMGNNFIALGEAIKSPSSTIEDVTKAAAKCGLYLEVELTKRG